MQEQYIKIDKQGGKHYFKDKEMTIWHREDGPAYESVDGIKTWCRNGKLHREDGPAFMEPEIGLYEWHWDGKELTEKQFNAKVRRMQREVVLTFDEIADKLGARADKLVIKK